MNSNSRSNAGFTLIEILIAITLIAFMSFGIYQIMGQTYSLRDTLLGDGDFYSEIRLAMGILDRDVSALYYPTLSRRNGATPGSGSGSQTGQPGRPPGTPNPPGQTGQVAAQQPVDLVALFGVTANDRSQYWGPIINKMGIRIPRFLGTPDTLQFIGTSHVRIYQDSPESIFSKIRYEFKDKALTKVERMSAFSMEETDRDTKREYPLLSSITKLVFKYYKRDKDQWSANWDSDRPETKDIFPDLIEVELEMSRGDRESGEKSQAFAGRFLLRPEASREGLYATF